MKRLSALLILAVMLTLSQVWAETIENTSLGICFTIPDEVDLLCEASDIVEGFMPYGSLSFIYVDKTAAAEIDEKLNRNEISTEEAQDLLTQFAVPLVYVYIMDDATASDIFGSSDLQAVSQAFPQYAVTMEDHNNYHYYIIDRQDDDQRTKFSEAQAAEYDRAHKEVFAILANAEYAEPVPQKPAPLCFTTKNLDGDTVTESVFREKALTVLNVFATWCNPCLNEMPELAAWEKEMPENVQILYLCENLTEDDAITHKTAEKIAELTGISSCNVLCYTQDFDGLMLNVPGFPSTFFVSSDGTLLPDMIVGANVPAYKNTVSSILSR